jgi:hypothetical protein
MHGFCRRPLQVPLVILGNRSLAQVLLQKSRLLPPHRTHTTIPLFSLRHSLPINFALRSASGFVFSQNPILKHTTAMFSLRRLASSRVSLTPPSLGSRGQKNSLVPWRTTEGRLTDDAIYRSRPLSERLRGLSILHDQFVCPHSIHHSPRCNSRSIANSSTQLRFGQRSTCEQRRPRLTCPESTQSLYVSSFGGSIALRAPADPAEIGPRVRCDRCWSRRSGSASGVRFGGGRIQHGLYLQAVPHPFAYCGGAGWYQCGARKHAPGRLAVAHVRHREGIRLAR